jgi:hypothetical protein
MVALLVTLMFGLGQFAAGPGEVTRTCKVVTPPDQHSHATHCHTSYGGQHQARGGIDLQLRAGGG